MSPEADNSGWTWRRWIVLAAGLGLAGFAWHSRGETRTPPAQPDRPGAPLPTRLAPEEMSRADAEREAAPLGSAYRRDVERPRPVQNMAPEAPARNEEHPSPPGGPSSVRRDEKKTLPEIFQMPAGAEPPAETAAPPRNAAARPRDLREDFAPFGRLVKCQLVNSLDSLTARAEPIVGIVTEDLDWNGKVVIPAGTEAFSYAKPEPAVGTGGAGRLVDTGEWTLVLPGRDGGENGRELVLRARAIDRRELETDARGAALSWEPGDGADGLAGTTVSSVGGEETALFAAAAISGMAQGIAAVAERQQAAPGVAGALGATQIAPTLGNAAVGAAGSGAVAVMNEYAGRIRDDISKKGVYVQVPAGKAFYLFVEQTIDPGAAAVGLRLQGGGGIK